MATLFVSDRVFLNNEFCAGGILVNTDGKIESVFNNRASVNDYLNSNKNAEVNIHRSSLEV